MGLSKAVQRRSLFQAYLQSLDARPVLTKSITAGSLFALSELFSGRFTAPKPTSTKSKEQKISEIKSELVAALKLGLYGFFICGPLDHHLMELVQKAFVGRTSKRWQALMIAAVNFLILPIQHVIGLATLSAVNGVTKPKEIVGAIKGSLLKILQMAWVLSTVEMIVAQKYIPESLWTPFFTAIEVGLFGTFINIREKLQAQKKDKLDQAKAEAEAKSAQTETEAEAEVEAEFEKVEEEKASE
ncbi:hypothetical protein MNV49_000044 [Pseudohyphozyma bogoriensis]|nr:hypothetical protein MNV49_000044 [Pseudohyphozyma bogoriensis]